MITRSTTKQSQSPRNKLRLTTSWRLANLKEFCQVRHKLVAIILPACSASRLLLLCHRSALGWCTLVEGAPSSCQNGASRRAAPSGKDIMCTSSQLVLKYNISKITAPGSHFQSAGWRCHIRSAARNHTPADWESPWSPGNMLQGGRKHSGSTNTLVLVLVGLKPILPTFHVYFASFSVLNVLWFAAFSQQLITRAPSSLTSESGSLIGSYTSCHADWMLQMQSRMQDVICVAEQS